MLPEVTYIAPNTGGRTQVHTNVQVDDVKYGRNVMKTILAAIALGLFSVTTFADPCMDANVSPLGHSLEQSADEIHLDEQGC